MKIAFLDGTNVVEPSMEERVYRAVRAMIKEEETVTFFCRPESEWMQLCEWAARKIEAAYPQKRVERIGVQYRQEPRAYIPMVRYTQILEVSPADGEKVLGVWRWMIEQADCAVTYFDPLLCYGQRQSSIYSYAVRMLGDRCVNLCSEKVVSEVRAQICTLPKWQRCAMLGRLNKTPKSLIAQELQVSRTTVHAYEMTGIYALIQSMRRGPAAGRCCAVFGLSAAHLTNEETNLVCETVTYLIRCCHVTKILLMREAISFKNELYNLLRWICSRYDGKVTLCGLHPQSEGTYRNVMQPEEGWQTVSRRAVNPAELRLEEKKAMMDEADIVLCRIVAARKSGLSYARKRHLPVINLASYSQATPVTAVEDWAEDAK